MKDSLIWSTQPIFISSTFSDMNAERDALGRFVFNELEEKLKERRVRLEPIDLRWGVETSTEKEKEQKELLVLKVCLNDIKRSKPFFIGIIGDRYGWVPPEERMRAAEKEIDFNSEIKNKSITALEIEYGVLASKDQLKRSFFFFREPLPYDKMPAGIKALYYEENSELQKSLQELKEAIIKSVGEERVFTYKAEWDGAKVNDKSLDDFKKKVADVLWKELDLHTKKYETERPQTWEEEEEIYLQDFIEDRTISFSGREDVISELKKFALGEASYDNWGKCVTGESGSGKSALIAKLYKELDKNKVGSDEKEHDIILLAHAAGISLRSNSLQNMLTIWIKQLAAILKIDVSKQLSEKPKSESEQLLERSISGDDKTKEKSKFEDLKNLFANLLSQAAVNERVVILVDALNQFERTVQAKYMSWLPDLIPANAKFIFTAIPAEETENISKRKGITLEALKEVGREDADKIINVICERYHKTLNRKAIEALLEKKKDDGVFSYSNPLWLTMAIDDFLLMDEDDFARMKELEGDAETRLTQLLIQTAEKMPSDIEGMYQYVFNRCKIFGADFVNGLLSYMGISRNGLRESDLENLVNNYANSKWENLKFAAFRRYMRNHIVQKGELGLWDFRHVKARESLKKSLLKDETTVVELHKNLSAHLDKLNEEDPLRLTEIIWHLFKCDDKRRAAEVYGSKNSTNQETKEYSATLLYVLLENENNVDWVCSMIGMKKISDEKKHCIIQNVQFSLDERIKNFVQLTLRLNIFKAVLLSSESLLKRNPGSLDYSRDKYVSTNFVGDIQSSMGDITSALENYQIGSDILEELRKLSPERAQISGDLAISYLKLGGIYEKLGQLEDAMKFYKDYNNLSVELNTKYPLDDSYKEDLAISYQRMGGVYETMGQLEDASKFYKDATKLNEELYKKYPQGVSFKKLLAISYSQLGTIYEKMGQLENAMKFYNVEVILFEELIKTYPQDVSYKNGLAISNMMLGGIFQKMGQLEKTLKIYKDAKTLFEDLHTAHPKDVSFKDSLGITNWKLGGIYQKMGQLEEALKFYKESRRLGEELHNNSPQDVSFKKGLAISYEGLGGIYQRMGQLEKALKFYKEDNKLSKELQSNYPQDISFKKGLSISNERLGGIYKKMGQLEDALKFYKEDNRISKELHTTYPKDVSLIKSLAYSCGELGGVYEKMGQLEEALNFYKDLIILCEDLHTTYPRDVSFKNGLAISYGMLGGIYQKMGQIEETLKIYKEAKILFEELHTAYPQDVSFKDSLTTTYSKLGAIYEKMGHPEDALKFYKLEDALRFSKDVTRITEEQFFSILRKGK